MTVHVISVGLSILDALGAPARTFSGQPDLASAVRTAMPQRLPPGGAGQGNRAGASDWLAGALAPAGAPGHDAASAGLLISAVQAVCPGLWAGDISAELATFTRLPASRRPLPRADIALLICSDTPEGLTAGLWNAVALTGGDPARVTYLASPKTAPEPLRGNAAIVRVPGMDAADAAGFAEAMAGLGTLGRHLLRSGDLAGDEPFRFYLSGGFKAAIPYLIGLAEGVRSLGPDRPVKAFVLHDTAPGQTPLIELPLRYLVATQVTYELSRFDQRGVRDTAPQPALLEGYAYEKTRGGKYQLTAFGAGLRALYGPPAEGLGG